MEASNFTRHSEDSRVAQLEREVRDLRAELKERDTLLKDVHHRVKNHLFLIIGLLNLERGKLSGKLSDPQPAFTSIDHIVDRIHIISTLYTHLYQVDPTARAISARAFLGRLAALVSSAQSDQRIRITTKVSDIDLPLPTALPVGLIVNEALSNSLKHAFPDGRSGSVTVELSFSDGERARLCLSDDGIGRPPGLSQDGADEVGTVIMNALVEQIGGSMRTVNNHGTTVEVEFSLNRDI